MSTIPRHASTILYANHIAVCTACIYLIVNFFRAFYEDRLHRRELVYICDILLFLINVVFVIDAILYWYAYIQQRRDGFIKDNNNNNIHNNLIVNNGYRQYITPTNRANGNIYPTSLFKWMFSTYTNTYYTNPLEGRAELLNIVGCLLYLCSSLFPLFTYINLRESIEARLDQLTYLFDCLAMVVFVIDSGLYINIWYNNSIRDINNSKILNKTALSWSDFVQYSLYTDAYLYGNLLNIIASFCYFVSVMYGFYIRVLTPHDGSDLVPLKVHPEYSDFTLWQRMIYDSTQKQRALMFFGDILYLICACAMEVGFYQEFNLFKYNSNNSNNNVGTNSGSLSKLTQQDQLIELEINASSNTRLLDDSDNNIIPEDGSLNKRSISSSSNSAVSPLYNPAASPINDNNIQAS